jgi:hypothetical protein
LFLPQNPRRTRHSVRCLVLEFPLAVTSHGRKTVNRKTTHCMIVLLFLAPNLCAAQAAPQDADAVSTVTWARLHPTNSPTPRGAPAMAYDPVSRKVVMFGGFTATTHLNDTWTFDGRTWTKQTTSVAPPPRAAGNMTYDAVSKTLILFGGFSGSSYLGDTWIWNGATSSWKAAHPKTLPPAMTEPAVFTDPRNGHAVIFGGYDGRFYQLNTWRWTGTDWQKLPGTPPSARSGMVAATDPTTKSSVIFDGLADVNPYNTWTWNGKTWKQQSPASQPPSRYNSAAAYDPALAAVVAFGGGQGGLDLNDTWAWTNTGATWTQLTPATSPRARESFGMAYDAALGHVVIFGGASGNKLLNDTWELKP